MEMTWPTRIMYWVLALGLGALFGAAGTITHSITLAGIPAGLILSIIAVGALLLAIRCFTPGRVATAICGIAMVAVTTILSGVGPGGSVVVPDTLLGRIWLYALAGIVLIAISWPDFSKIRAAQAQVQANAAATQPE